MLFQKSCSFKLNPKIIRVEHGLRPHYKIKITRLICIFYYQVFCCPQPQPYYCPYPCMPPPNCCPPPPCPPPPCCADPFSGGGGKGQTGCCGAGTTLVRIPKGYGRGQRGGDGGGGQGSPPFQSGLLDKPASYNNCNFYVSELPKGMGRGAGSGASNGGTDRLEASCYLIDEKPLILMSIVALLRMTTAVTRIHNNSKDYEVLEVNVSTGSIILPEMENRSHHRWVRVA